MSKKFLLITSTAILLIMSPLYARSFGSVRQTIARGGRLIPEKQIGTATASYFPKENHVTVQIRPLQIDGDLQNGVILIPSFIVPGKKVVAPKTINVQFIVDSPVGERSSIRNVQFYVEGKELISGVPVMVSSSQPSNDSVTRILMYKMPYGKFLRMVEGKAVKVKMGEFEFELTEAHLQSMQDLRRVVSEQVRFP